MHFEIECSNNNDMNSGNESWMDSWCFVIGYISIMFYVQKTLFSKNKQNFTSQPSAQKNQSTCIYKIVTAKCFVQRINRINFFNSHKQWCVQGPNSVSCFRSSCYKLIFFPSSINTCLTYHTFTCYPVQSMMYYHLHANTTKCC